MGTGMPHRAREVHVSLSGEIVSAWEPEKVQALCRWINELKGHGTRVDVALDDRTGHATVSDVIAAADAGQAMMLLQGPRRHSRGDGHVWEPTERIVSARL